MASTYSNNLRLELIGTGDQAGTWGQTTNTNLGTLLDNAISGSVSVTVSAANTALTALNGANDQSRYMMLVLDTSTGADFAVYTPPAPKVYVVRNASSYVATIYNSTVLGNTTAAGTGIAVSAGNSILVFTDGTNFRTLDIDELVGTLAVTNGGTGLTTLTANNVILGNGTSTPQFVAPGASGNLLTSNGTTWASAVPAPSVITGSLLMWPTGSAPTGYLLCNGTAVSRTTYSALFGVVGTTFGVGDGSTTFNLPNYQDRMPIGAGSTYSAADTGGSKDAIVVSHSHTATDSGHVHQYTYWDAGGSGLPYGEVSQTSGYVSPNTQTGYANISVSTTGSSGTNANLPPYLGIYFIIKT